MLGSDDEVTLATAVRDLAAIAKELKDRRGTSQVVHQHMDSGGRAVWVVVVAAAVIFTAAVTQGPRITELERKVDRLQDYVNVVYQQKDTTNVNDNHHNETEGGKQNGK